MGANLCVANLCVFGSIKQMDYLKLMMELDIQYYLVLKDMMQFMIGLEIL